MPLKCEPLCCFGSRLYFTSFSHPLPKPDILNKLAAEPGNQPQVRSCPRGGPSVSPDDNALYYYFTIDDQLLYLSFFQDWGPLNIAMVYKACIYIHELLEDKELAQHRLILYSSDDPRKKANAALLVALYVMIVQRRAPWEAFHPVAELELMPFRDAGRGPSDFNLNIQDCLWGVWKAMQHGLCDMNEFSIEDYEYYEKVENGDWNWITPNFIAFASPVDTNWIKRQKEDKADSSLITASRDLAFQRKLPTPFLNCLDYFEKRNIKLVVRLNTELYDRNTFLDRGIDHMELYFDDGTNPTDEIVRTFIDVADKIVESGGVIAVHCKAGLGRTGTLIGAYLIWKYGFTANEAIAFMRIIRPGSVVGPQQQYMYLKQLEWVKWSAMDEAKRQAASATKSSIVTPATPPAETDDEMDIRSITPPINTVSLPPVTPSRHIASATARAKAIVPPGQPRKTPKTKRMAEETEEEDNDVLPVIPPPPTTRNRSKTLSKVPSIKDAAATEQRPIRVTRSTAGAVNIRRAGTAAATSNATSIPESPVKVISTKQGPHKIPRLATTRTTAAARAVASVTSRQTTTRALTSTTTPSRLPTLMSSKRPHHTSSLSEVTGNTPPRAQEKSGADGWVNNTAVVGKTSKSDRPNLRCVRRRRSSFSNADVVV